MRFRRISLTFLLLISIFSLVSCDLGNKSNNPDKDNQTTDVQKEYVVTFQTNGGTQIESVKTDSNGKITKPEDPIKEGYVFKGWYSDYALTKGLNVSAHIFDKDTTIYAKWTPVEIIIKFFTNGGSSINDIKIPYGHKITLSNPPTKKGHNFAGWYLDSEYKNKFDENISIKESLYLYAKWDINQFTVSFNTNGGTVVEDMNLSYGNKVELPTEPTKVGYSFEGWYTDTSLTTLFDSNSEITSNITLHAKWEIEYFIVSFEANNGKVIEDKTVSYGNKVELPIEPTKVGYSFVGWYTDVNLTTAFNSNSEITSNITLYAKWEIAKFTVSFNSNGGTVVENMKVPYGNKVELPTSPTKVGYSFVGWYTDVNLTTAFNSNSEITSNITLYAKWDFQNVETLLGNFVTSDEEYYGVVAGMLDDELKETLHQLLEDTHTNQVTYKEAWTLLAEADKGEGDTIECIYTGRYINVADRDGSSSASIVWNREHAWPNSKGFKDYYPAYSDCFHLFASEKNINSTRGNKDFGDFDLLGITNTGSDSYGNKWNNDYFEPRDEVKGDIARAMLYLVVRYDGDTCNNCTLDLELIEGDSDNYTHIKGQEGYLGDLETLIKWHYEDPVSDEEMARNEVVSRWQGNRNPFIDHPEFVYGLYSEYASQYVS